MEVVIICPNTRLNHWYNLVSLFFANTALITLHQK